jgi:ribonuclease D
MKEIQVFNNDIPFDFNLEGDIAIDTETMGLNLFRDRLCVIQMSNDLGDATLVKFDGNDYSAPNLRKLLSDQSKTMIFHYARFDVAVIKKFLNVRIEKIFCTKIASKLIRTYTDSHGLKELCRELLNTQLSKQQQSSDWGSPSLSKEQITYAASDVIYLHQIKNLLETMLIRENRLLIAEKLFQFINIRVELDLMGFENCDIFAHH